MADNVTPVVLSVDKFDDREVYKVDYKFIQKTDIEGQLDGIPRGGRINVIVKALNNGNTQLLQWMLNPTDARDVKVVFNSTKDGSVMKTIEAKGCYCVHYKENWADGQLHSEEISIVCQEMKIGSVEFKNLWS
ncbi:MAG: hypothetical protein MJY69_07585 [Bacteroidales bacterium]|nr:hypothetical protein [Bacteroidales bacterium]